MMSALPLPTMIETLETINIMTYDFASSSFGPCVSGHHSNLYSTSYAPQSVDAAVKAYMDRGVPREKIVVGAVLYSRGFANTEGLGCPSSGLVSDKSWEGSSCLKLSHTHLEGVCDVKTLPRPGAIEYWDDRAKATYSYDPNKKILNSYDSARSVAEKAKYVWDMGLRGIIVWESAGDFAFDDPRSVLLSLVQNLQKDPRT